MTTHLLSGTHRLVIEPDQRVVVLQLDWAAPRPPKVPCRPVKRGNKNPKSPRLGFFFVMSPTQHVLFV
jgi:hypothetical protein